MRNHHLDTNHHVNNQQFINMAIECIPENFAIRQMRAEYKKQAFLGDVLIPFVAENEGIYTVSLQDGEGKPYAVVEFTRTTL